MQLYDATNDQGLCQEIDRLCDTTDTSYPRKDKTARINQAYELVAGWLIDADGNWQFDDSNYTTLPIGRATLLEGQQSYSFTSTFLMIEAVDILDTNGVYQRIKPIDHKELGGLSPDEYFGNTTSQVETGFPLYYDKWEDTIKLYPAPTSADVTLTNGLKIYTKRTANLFTVATDTSADTTEPGFASPWHVILAYMASVPYCQTYKQDRVPWLSKEVDRMKKELIDHYSRREEDVEQVIRPKHISFR